MYEVILEGMATSNTTTNLYKDGKLIAGPINEWPVNFHKGLCFHRETFKHLVERHFGVEVSYKKTKEEREAHREARARKAPFRKFGEAEGVSLTARFGFPNWGPGYKAPYWDQSRD